MAREERARNIYDHKSNYPTETRHQEELRNMHARHHEERSSISLIQSAEREAMDDKHNAEAKRMDDRHRQEIGEGGAPAQAREGRPAPSRPMRMGEGGAPGRR